MSPASPCNYMLIFFSLLFLNLALTRISCILSKPFCFSLAHCRSFFLLPRSPSVTKSTCSGDPSVPGFKSSGALPFAVSFWAYLFLSERSPEGFLLDPGRSCTNSVSLQETFPQSAGLCFSPSYIEKSAFPSTCVFCLIHRTSFSAFVLLSSLLDVVDSEVALIPSFPFHRLVCTLFHL